MLQSASLLSYAQWFCGKCGKLELVIKNVVNKGI